MENSVPFRCSWEPVFFELTSPPPTPGSPSPPHHPSRSNFSSRASRSRVLLFLSFIVSKIQFFFSLTIQRAQFSSLSREFLILFYFIVANVQLFTSLTIPDSLLAESNFSSRLILLKIPIFLLVRSFVLSLVHFFFAVAVPTQKCLLLFN